jgi:hypothetical protein
MLRGSDRILWRDKKKKKKKKRNEKNEEDMEMEIGEIIHFYFILYLGDIGKNLASPQLTLCRLAW